MSSANGPGRVSGELTSRQREWLAHLKRCDASGETKKAYAKRHQLSVQAMYQAAKDLRGRGALPPAIKPGSNQAAPFVRVSVPQATAAVWRVRFASGAVLESASPLSTESLATLVDALSASR
jgi:hypothetical protein